MKKARSDALTQTVKSLLRWVEKRLSQTIRGHELESAAGYCIRHLGKGFQKVTGVSPARYILLRKLTLAAHMLRLTCRSVTDIAMQYAFGSLQNFSRAFRRHFGLSPQSYRRNQLCPPEGLTIPPPTESIYRHTVRRICLEGLWLLPNSKQKIKIPLDATIMASETGNLREDLYKLFYNRLFRHNKLKEFTILARIAYHDGYDVEVHTTTCISTPAGTPGAIYTPTAQWICFEFSGSLRDIFDFHQWVNNYALRIYGLTQIQGMTFTSYHYLCGKTAEYAISYYLPLSPPCPAKP
ncbi:TPA: helix-turn-helix domain-containing protein [Salmonella enterica subsp. diarizonae serovar 61:l,v:z35]